MEKNETPQPITLEEFKSGVEFFKYDKLDPMNMDTYQLKDCSYSNNIRRYIVDKKGNFYCHIQKVEDDGFTFIHYVFGFPVEGKVFFKNCFKTEIQ